MVKTQATPEQTSSSPADPAAAPRARQRLLLLDGHSMAFRAFFALPVEKFGTSTGQSTNAVYGFTSMLVKLLRDEQPTHIAVAWDRSEPTFRHEAYDEYKGGRAETPPEFPGQVALLQELLGLLGVASVSVAGFEADDIIATLAVQGCERGMEVLIASGDRDAFQLVTDACTVLYPGKSLSDLTRMTPDAVEAKYGVAPQRYRDLAALVGEKSDNLPGVPGVGPKTAAKWITKYGSLDGLVARADEITGKAGQSLRDHLDDVLRNQRLNALATDVEIGAGLDDLTMDGWDRAGINTLFDDLEFAGTLRERLFSVLGEEESEDGAAPEEGFSVELSPLGTGEVSGWLASHATTDARAGLAVSGSWGRGGGEVADLAIAVAAGPAAHIDPALLDSDDEAALAAWLADPERPKALHDAKGPLLALGARGWELRGLTSDTALAAYLALPGRRSFDLADLCTRYLNRELDEQQAAGAQLTLDIAGGGDDAAQTARHDLALRARATLDLAAALDADLERRGATRLLREVELPLLRVLADAERVGIAADRAYLDELEAEFAAAVRQAVQEAHRVVGREFNLGSPKQLQQILFTELGLPKTKRIKTGYTTDADALAWLAAQTDNELPVILLRHRDQTRLRVTVEGLIKTVADDGRIHTTFNQTVAATGRLSSTDPNLQNIPVRTDAGRRIRRAFVVGGGYEHLLTADYSQIELRIMAHLSGDASLIEAFETGHDFHAEIAARVFKIPAEEVGGEARAKIKAMNYGLAYGLSAFGLSGQLGITPEEARGLMDDYFAQFGRVRDYLYEVVERARRDGYTETMLGRRRYLPDLTSDNRQRREMAERMALNAPIQGSAADIIKVAMLDVDAGLREGAFSSRLLLQVHDELVLEVVDAELGSVRELVSQRMAGAYDLRVPLAVSVGVGHNWHDAAH
ncbi:DNA polymerase-1 [Spinactinospora alkalitolerans]|uniref:DNA polymerase I n=1 Tax=Spinactinospora alkalitolerans TaxID=687207 RepID=A0A852TYY5_9ACTN|nr:DNA polymerase I [Spinactinospora alkalitolerans]NYE48517.1 DNA polymerase-1 [Spinactinospora alkalitolerans]